VGDLAGHKAVISVEILPCAICGSPLRSEVKVHLPNAHLRACAACGSWTYLPRQNSPEQVAIHDTEDYFDHPYFELRRNASPALIRRCRNIFSCLAEGMDINALRGEQLLDVGCDTGVFLWAAAQEFGIVPVGVDVSRRAIAAALSRGIDAYASTIEGAPEHLRGFRVITAVDLIEHVADPAAFLREVRNRLRPGGVLYVETPNARSAVYRIGAILSQLTQGRPAALLERLFPPQHLQYFTAASLARLARAAGLEAVRIDNRVLPWEDIAASLPVRVAMSAMQVFDRWAKTEILIWAVLRRPISGS
jgi:2-polyprenyl-3-methyl-5-hydroxy-6-metoxy-1,4-benzoquinol methylase